MSAAAVTIRKKSGGRLSSYGLVDVGVNEDNIKWLVIVKQAAVVRIGKSKWRRT